MKIDNIELGKYPVLLAPMEDVTDLGFRLMCKQFGADLVYTEFVSSDALIRQVNKSMQKLTISDEERPVAIQIYGRASSSVANFNCSSCPLTIFTLNLLMYSCSIHQ